MSTHNIKYIFKKMAKFILLLKDYGFVHDQISLRNAIICGDDDETNFQNNIPSNKKKLKF